MIDKMMHGDEMNVLMRDLCSMLNYHRHLGIDGYPRSTQLERFFETRKDRSDAGVRDAGRHVEKTGKQVEKREKSVQAVRTAKPVDGGAIVDIREEVAGCSRCTLAASRVVPVAGEGPERAKLLIVGEWLTVPERHLPPVGCVFGVEQDQMLTRMLEAIGLKRKDVFITNIIKCGVRETCQPKAEHAAACVAYVQRQMSALTPQVVCTMGRVATRMILGKKEPLSRLRGRIHRYEGTDGVRTAVVPTYHPSFLLQNPEMKKATWLDLQLLARELGIRLG